ncbi:DUF6279 family lipoprotein [Marinobacter salicampi]|uniref:DUF6279 family lipoprotein n=1 Tax=Marinobacter salicampi TaxID=435907 RepID=UPI0014079B6C|nr:DUF6279 family lipoprotein [Marinobacter salicampi]
MSAIPLRGLALALLLVVLAGCSSTRTAYRFADWGIVWWVDDYVTLTEAQEASLKQDIKAFKQWHCGEELPIYSGWLAGLEADIAKGNSNRQLVRARFEELSLALDRLLVRITPTAVDLLSGLGAVQVAQLDRTMAEKHREKEEEFLSPDPEEQRQRREDRTRERVERWLGELGPEQQELIRQWNLDRGNQTEIWLEGRRRWQERLSEALGDRHREDFEPRLANLIQNSQAARGPEYQAMVQDSRTALIDLITGLLQDASPEQRRHLIQELADLRRDFRALQC